MRERLYTPYHALVQHYNRVARVFDFDNTFQQFTNDLLFGDDAFFLCGVSRSSQTGITSIPQMFYQCYISSSSSGGTGWEPWQFLLCSDPTDTDEIGTYTTADLDSFLTSHFGFPLRYASFRNDWTSNTLLRPISDVIDLCDRMLDLFRWRVRPTGSRSYTVISRNGGTKQELSEAVSSCLAQDGTEEKNSMMSWRVNHRSTNASYTCIAVCGEPPCRFEGIDPWEDNTCLQSLDPAVKIYWTETENRNNGGTGPIVAIPKQCASIDNYDLQRGVTIGTLLGSIPSSMGLTMAWSIDYTSKISAIDCANLI